MLTPTTLPIEDTGAIAEALATRISSSLRMLDDRLDDAHVRFLAHEAVAADRDLATVSVRVAAAARTIVAGKVGEQLASAVRLSHDALASHDGNRRWLQNAHKATLNAFHKTAEDYRAGKATHFDRFLAQTALASISQARRLLGLPIEPAQVRQIRYSRPFEPVDYPSPRLRTAIVNAVFTGDEASIAIIREHAGHLPADQDGRVTILLNAIDNEDEGLRTGLFALAGQILGEDRQRFEVKPQPVPDFAAMARQLASTLRRHGRHTQPRASRG